MPIEDTTHEEVRIRPRMNASRDVGNPVLEEKSKRAAHTASRAVATGIGQKCPATTLPSCRTGLWRLALAAAGVAALGFRSRMAGEKGWKKLLGHYLP